MVAMVARLEDAGAGESCHRWLTDVGASRSRLRNARARARLAFNLDSIKICPLIGADQKGRAGDRHDANSPKPTLAGSQGPANSNALANGSCFSVPVTEECDMQDQENAAPTIRTRAPWNKGKLTGAKPPLRSRCRRDASVLP